ncbi:MAG: RAD55 family ATPase [Candidatus Helarchaeota archaeon]
MGLIRFPIGIHKLDKLIGGGLVCPSILLLIGHPGSGKTTFTMQYLFEGARHRQKGIYFTALSNPINTIMFRFISNFWFCDTNILGKKIFFIDLSQKISRFTTGDEFLSFIDEKIWKYKIKRIVIDPINVIKLFISPNNKEYRLFFYKFIKYIKEKDLQLIITKEYYTSSDLFSFEAYMADGIIFLQNSHRNHSGNRTLKIIKMRGVQHFLNSIEYQITNNGLVLKIID